MKKFKHYTTKEKILAITLSLLIAVGVVIGSFVILRSFESKASVKENSLSLSPDSGKFTPGEEFRVNVELNTGLNEINVGAATLNFNKDQLELKNIQRNTANQDVASPSFESDLGSTTSIDSANQAGKVMVSGLTGDQYHNANGWFKGTGTLATLTFVGKKAGTVAELSFDKNASSLVRVSDNTDVLEFATSGHYTIGDTGNQPSITVEPDTGEYQINKKFNTQLKINSFEHEINVAAAYLSFNPAELKVDSFKKHTANQNSENPIFESDMGSSTNLAEVNKTGKLAIVGLTGDAYHNEHGWFKGEGTLADITFVGLKNDITAKVWVDKPSCSLARVSDNQNILGYVTGGEYKISEIAVADSFTASIKLPQNGASFKTDDKVTFEGVVNRNAAAVSLADEFDYKWSSDKADELSTELKFDKDNLATGEHKITFEVKDKSGKQATDEASITISDFVVTEDPASADESGDTPETGGFAGIASNLPTAGIIFGSIVLIALVITFGLWIFSRRKVGGKIQKAKSKN